MLDPIPARRKLLAWYDLHRRDLPWRSATPDPYRIWLAEVMLQQTRVDTVRPYYERWLQQFPTLSALAAAPLDQVLKAWEGLGYYSRARNFHAAVREVGDAVPDDPQRFRRLPGVGRYTAGAVMSIAFGREEPVVDGNVRRVFARWLDAPDERHWDHASRLVKGDRPGDLNQALMELGATVCTPRAPACDRCPIADLCSARATGTQLQRPAPRRRGPLPQEERGAMIVTGADGAVLLGRSPARGRLGGLWEFPESPESVGIEVEGIEALGTVVHTFTHVRVSYHAIRARLRHGEARALAYDDVAWTHDLAAFALPRAQQKIAALGGLGAPDGTKPL